MASLLIFRPHRPSPAAKPGVAAAVLVASRAIPSRALIRDGDLVWREIPTATARPGSLSRGKVTPAQFMGAVTRQPIAVGEIVLGGDLIAPGDRRFLAAVLDPGMGAVTLAVDIAQSAAGLIMPDDHVDVILVQDSGAQSGAAGGASKGSVAQIMLRDVRVVAVDHAFDQGRPVAAVAAVASVGSLTSSAASAADSTPPRTLTLEVTDRDAQKVFLAEQLGKVQFSLRALVQPEAGGADAQEPVWAGDVTPVGFSWRSPQGPVMAPPFGQALFAPQAAPILDKGAGSGGGRSGIRIVRGSKAATP